MPNMADITVKANNGTTDVIFVAKNPSAGDSVPALWRADAEGLSAAAKPTFTMASRWNGPKTARRMDLNFVYNQTATNTTTGLVSIVNRIPFSCTVALPAEVPDTVIQEATARFVNLLASVLVKASINSGFAPT